MRGCTDDKRRTFDLSSCLGGNVAFGTLCELVAENADPEKIKEYVTFSIKVGLPTTLKDLHIEATDENIRLIAENTMQELLSNEPMEVSGEQLQNIIKAADAIGRYYKSQM